KWYSTEKAENEVDYAVADRIWELCAERNIPMRGHCIFWAKDKYVMPWLKALDNDELRAAIGRRALDVTRHFKGRIDEFDLNNEMIHGDFFRRRLGYGIINEMALWARMGNPEVQLYLNDYGVLDGGFNADTYLWQIRTLLANGVPIDGIGCQAHLAHSYESITSPEHVQKWLDILAEFNLPIKITENLFVFQDERVQEEQLRTLFPIYFAHPSVTAIVTWGFWAKGHWLPHAAMYREDWSPRPQALAYRELVYDQWWTRTAGAADAAGVYKTRAFYGDYKITADGESRIVRLCKKDGTAQVIF
ncbi:1,4-beta-xylanase, partial [candidate division KSB1 bacterium]